MNNELKIATDLLVKWADWYLNNSTDDSATANHIHEKTELFLNSILNTEAL